MISNEKSALNLTEKPFLVGNRYLLAAFKILSWCMDFDNFDYMSGCGSEFILLGVY